MRNSSRDSEMNDIVNNIIKGVENNKKNRNPKKEQKDHNNYHKTQNDYISDIPDYYKILNVFPSDSQERIMERANKKLAKYHPDKIKSQIMQYPVEERQKQAKKYESMYKLIMDARDTLLNQDKRKYYDLQLKSSLNNSSNHKKSFDEYKLRQEKVGNFDEKKKLAEIEFQKSIKVMDKKRDFDSTKKMGQTEYKIDHGAFNQMMDDCKFTRKQDEADCMPKYQKMDNETFNKQFEKIKIKKERKRKPKNDDKSIIKWEGLSAYGDHGQSCGNYMKITQDGEYNDLFEETEEQTYQYTKLTSDDEQSLSSVDDDLMEDIECVGSKYAGKQMTMQDYETKMKEREMDDSHFDKRRSNDGSWGNIMENPFNISCQMGSIVGKDMVNDNQNKMNKNMMDACNQLMYDRDK